MRISLLLIFICISFLASSQSLDDINKDINKFYKSIIHDGKVDYTQAKKDQRALEDILDDIKHFNISETSILERRAMQINAYNLLVIQSVLSDYPTASVQKIDGFFEKEHFVMGQSLSLDQLENEIGTTDDPRLHFLLVCGALSCPPLYDEAISAEKYVDQIKEASEISLKSRQILQVSEIDQRIEVNQIFKWNIFEFEDLIGFINEHGGFNIPSDYEIRYLPYDWALNDIKGTTQTGVIRYFASRLYGKGEFEVSMFNNYYTQLTTTTFETRSNFFSTFINYYHGISDRLNLGLEIKFRSVTEGPTFLVGRWESLKFQQQGFGIEGDFSRIGFTAITPKIKYNPFKGLGNISLQHAVSIPLLYSGEGDSEYGYIDWSTPSIFNDFFYDQILNEKASLFVQVGFYLENVGPLIQLSNNGFYQFTTPITVLPSFFITPKSTLYLLMNAAPRWGYNVQNEGDVIDIIPDHYNQYGIGFKYFLTDKLEGELLATKFFSSTPNRSAATFNLGFRYFGWK